jgi:DNA repair exonuclease SbcCD nuclease subunit
MYPITKVNSYRILIFSDLHIYDKSIWSKPTKGTSDYLCKLIQSVSWICDCIKKHEPNVVAFCGDLFETSDYVGAESLDAGVKISSMLADACMFSHTVIPIISLLGNHDIYSNNAMINNLAFLKLIMRRTIHSYRIIEKPTMFVDEESRPYKDYGLYCVPYQKNLTKLQIPEGTRLVLSHLDVIGVPYNEYKSTEVGIPSEYSVPIFNGHYHNPSKVGNVYNIGSLLSRTLKDANSEPRGIYVVDIDGEHIEVTRLTNYHDIVIKTIEAKTEDDICSLASNDLSNTFIKVTCSEDIKECAEVLKDVAYDAVVSYVSTKRESSANVFSEKFSPKENLELYVMANVKDPELATNVVSMGCTYLDKVIGKQDSCVVKPITLESIYINNYQSLGDIYFDFQTGLTYIEGWNKDRSDSNGSGKSSLHEALFWCLTGKSLRGYEGDDIISHGADNCKVEINLIIGGTRYKIGRYRKNQIYGSCCKLFIDETFFDGSQNNFKDISARKSTDTSKIINDLIGRSSELLRHSVFLTSDLSDRFTSLSYPAKIELIEEITNSQIYKEAYRYTSSDMAIVAGEISSLNVKHNTYDELIHKYLNEIKILYIELDTVKSKELVHEDVSGLVTRLNEERNKIVTENNNLIELATAKLGITKPKIQELINERMDLLTKVRYSEARLFGHTAYLKEKQSLIDAGKCPTCGSLIMSNYDSEIIPVKSDVEKLNFLIDTMSHRVNDINTQIKELSVVCDRLEHVIDVAKKNDECSVIERKLTELNESDKKYQKELQEKTTAITVIESNIKSIDKLYDDTCSLMTHCTNEIIAKNSVQSVLTVLTRVFHTQGIRAKVLDSITLPYINNRLEYYSSRFGVKAYLTNQVETKSGEVRDKIEVVLPNMNYVGSSSGERRVVDLMLQLSLNDLAVAVGGSSINVLFCDEIIGPLDTTAVMFLIEVLKEKSINQSVFLADHRGFLDQFVDRKIKLIKENGITRMEE